MKEYCNINNSQEEGFVDLVFDIVKIKKKLNGNLYNFTYIRFYNLN